MKIFKILTVFVFFFFLTAPSAFSAEPLKVGVFHFNRIAKESDAGKQAMAELQGDVEKKEQDIGQRKAELLELKTRMETEAPILDRESLEEKQRQFRIKLNDFQDLQKQYKKQIQEFQKRIFLLMQRM